MNLQSYYTEDASRNVRQHPGTCGHAGKDPWDTGNHTGLSGQDPEDFGQDPEEFGQDPEEFGQDPKDVGQDPEEFGQDSEDFGQDAPTIRKPARDSAKCSMS